MHLTICHTKNSIFGVGTEKAISYQCSQYSVQLEWRAFSEKRVDAHAENQEFHESLGSCSHSNSSHRIATFNLPYLRGQGQTLLCCDLSLLRCLKISPHTGSFLHHGFHQKYQCSTSSHWEKPCRRNVSLSFVVDPLCVSLLKVDWSHKVGIIGNCVHTSGNGLVLPEQPANVMRSVLKVVVGVWGPVVLTHTIC